MIVSYGTDHPARITREVDCTWDEYVRELTTYTEATDKAARGWSIPAQFSPRYRDSDNFVARHALTFDYDHVTPDDMQDVLQTYTRYKYVAYQTWSSTPEHPRWRLVFPLTRPVGFDEFQAVSRAFADMCDIELTARESHVPVQMMYLPTVKPGAEFMSLQGLGTTVDPDTMLSSYHDWTNRGAWPRHSEGDEMRTGERSDPRDIPGLRGVFCRQFPFGEAVARFELPYERVR